MIEKNANTLQDFQVVTPVKLSLLWAALMSLYIYNDYISLYVPSQFQNLANGVMGPLGKATDPILIGIVLLMAIPALMICVPSMVSPIISKWANILFGLVYTVVEILTIIGSRPYYQIMVSFEIIVSLAIIWTAMRWPRNT
jgi:hypothetical protein